MQHAFRKAPHRSTIWRINQRLLKTQFEPQTVEGLWEAKAKRGDLVEKAKLSAAKRARWRKVRRRLGGRRETSDQIAASYILFTAAVIDLMNTKGYCNYGEIWKPQHRGFGLPYREAPSGLVAKLSASGFPPAQLAVAVCDLIPLNLKTRGGPNSSNNQRVKDKAAARIRNPKLISVEPEAPLPRSNDVEGMRGTGFEEDRNLVGTVSYEHPLEPGDEDYQSESDIETEVQARTFELNRRLAPLIKSGMMRDEAVNYLAAQTDPKFKKRGTPAHRVNFAGAKLSRRMEHYWKKTDGGNTFRACKRFLKGLFTRQVPTRPHPLMCDVARVENQVSRYFWQQFRKACDLAKAEGRPLPTLKQRRPPMATG